MKRIGILSDTHSCWDDRYSIHFAGCDEIWHAGDVGDATILDRLEDIAPLRTVRGNVDHGDVARRCPELDVFDCEGVRVLLTHIGGYPGRWSKGMPGLIRQTGAKLVVDGHSHILKVMYDDTLGALLINPGAAGVQGWQKVRTLIRIVIDGEDIRDCEVIELGREMMS